MLVLSFITAVLTITGASCAEELEEYEVEKFERLAAHPLDLNGVTRSRLLSSGLLSAYQVASLIDYRECSGDILSYTELGLVDGFSPELAEALKEFTRLESAAPPGSTQSKCTRHDLMLRYGCKDSGEAVHSYGAKYSFEYGDRFEFNWGTRVNASEPELTPGTASAAWYGRRRIGKVVIGDICARFGQGLAAWSGFSMSGFSSVGAFSRSGGGLSPSSSFTSTLKGAGMDFNTGKWTATAIWAYPDIAIASISRIGRNCSTGLDFAGNTLSADWKAGGDGFVWFGEAGICLTNGGSAPAALSGIIFVPRYGWKAGLVARWYPDEFKSQLGSQPRSSSRTCDEHGIAAGLDSPYLSASLDAAFRPSKQTIQYKATATAHKEWNPFGNLILKPSLRLSARYRPEESNPLRSGLRMDLSASAGDLALNTRLELSRCRETGWLWYAEAVWKRSWIRWTLFSIDNWDDRIYVYERDAPGNFSSPAYYRRGWKLSAMLGLKKSGRHAFYLRASATDWPWTPVGRPEAVAEVKLQYQACFF